MNTKRISPAIYLPRPLCLLAICHQAPTAAPPRPFRRFRSMGYATEFHQNLDAVCITKASDQDPSQQSSRASSSLSPSLVASDGECPRATSLQPASLVEESNRHQGAVLRYVQRAVYLGLVTEVPRIWCLWRGVTSFA